MALLAKFITVLFQQSLVRRRMDAVAIIATAFTYGFMAHLAGKILRAMAGKAQFRRFPDHELIVLALVRLVASIAHADLERAVLLSSREFFRHMTIKAKPWC